MKKINYTGSNVTVMVSSMAKAVKFYTETLGLKLKKRESSYWAEVTAPGITIGLHPKVKNKTFKNGDTVSIGLEVSDIDTAINELRKKGIEFAVQKDSFVHLAYFNDIDDNILYLFKHKK